MPTGGTTRARRRKVALACDSCREKKVRCDGNKPICGPCNKRSYRVDQCVYTTENARSASRDRYTQTLHQRIRELEDACQRAGVEIQTPSSTPQTESRPPRESRQEPTPNESTGEQRAETHNPEPGEGMFDDSEGQITGMGQIATPDAGTGVNRPSTRIQYYGSSSNASLMRLAWESLPRHLTNGSRPEPLSSRLQDTFTEYRFDDFTLPPRALADHLLACFFDRVYNIYPFFHRPSFEAAYQQLWCTENERSSAPLTDLRIGLGSSADSGPQSIVFHTALNVIFALGCHFTELPRGELELVAHSFFLRAKRFIGLDFLDVNTIGVVQALLITALYLQSSPYPSRCWHSVGVACRIALGLGLHESDIFASLTPLELDIRRRTWAGCVMLDMTLSMTYGRPSMTTHLGPVSPPPSENAEEEPSQPSTMAFYNEAIKLYDILDKILADIYKAWRGHRPRNEISQQQQQQQQPTSKSRLGGLDTVLEIERQLAVFGANVPPFLKWTTATPHTNIDQNQNLDLDLALAQQRNVLHARYIHLHLLVYRPIFTQLYSETVRRRDAVRIPWQGGLYLSSSGPTSTLYTSMLSKCATACINAAIDLTHLIHETYRTGAADAWWYHGFYISTAAILLLMSFSAPSMLDSATMTKARAAWREATAVLGEMATFSRSASNTLQFLQAAYRQAGSGSGEKERDDSGFAQQQEQHEQQRTSWGLGERERERDNHNTGEGVCCEPSSLPQPQQLNNVDADGDAENPLPNLNLPPPPHPHHHHPIYPSVDEAGSIPSNLYDLPPGPPDPTTQQLPFFNWEEFAAEVGPGFGLDDLGFLTRADFDFDFPDTLA
ncbi:fungal-specific transcription factor domain-containing protein [Aspergillus heterothallicus]